MRLTDMEISVVYRYIDDEAFGGLETAGPMAAAVGVRAHDNLAELAETTAPHGGWSTLYGESAKLCSAYPVSWPVGTIYVAPADAGMNVLVRLDISSREWSEGITPPAGNCAQLAVTALDERGHYRLPAEGSWTQTTVAVDTPLSVDLPCALEGASGLVTILLWTWSEAQYEVSTVIERTNLAAGGFVVANTAPMTAPDFGAQVRRDAPKAGADRERWPIYQVCNLAGHALVETTPIYPGTIWPAASGHPERDDYVLALYSLGVILLSGVTIRGVSAAPALPGRRVYYPTRPLSELSVRPLAAVCKGLAERRRAHHLTHPDMGIAGRITRQGGAGFVPGQRYLLFRFQRAPTRERVDSMTIAAGLLVYGRPELRPRILLEVQEYSVTAGGRATEGVYTGEYQQVGPMAREHAPGLGVDAYYSQVVWTRDRAAWSLRGALLSTETTPGPAEWSDHRGLSWFKSSVPVTGVPTSRYYDVFLRVQGGGDYWDYATGARVILMGACVYDETMAWEV